MTKSKSIVTTYILAFALCLMLVLGVCIGATTFVAHAEEGKNVPQIVSVEDKDGNVIKVKDDMVNLPIGIVGEEYYVKIVTANTGDKVSIKSYDDNVRGCLPNGLTFSAETNEITGTLGLFPENKNNDGITIYCTNEYGSTNILAWLNIYTEADKPTFVSEEIPETAYVGSLYSAKVKVGGYTQNFSVKLEGAEGVNYPKGMEAYKSGIYACVSFKPTSDMAGKPYNFTICVDNGVGVATKDCTITVANEVEAPKFITKTQPLGYTDDNTNGVRPIVGENFEFWLQVSGTNTADNPLEFFLSDASNTIPETMQDEYLLGGNLYLTKEGKIYSTNVEAVSGNQISNLYIGVRNKNGSGNYTSANTTIKYCYINIVNGYAVDSFTISPAGTDIPKGGTRKFTANIKGVNFDTLDITWEIWGNQDESTSIDNNGLITIGLNETGYKNGDLKGKLEVVAFINGSTRSNIAIITLADHVHTTSVVEKVEKTCTKGGNIKHYKCTICDGLFADAGATENLTEAGVKTEAAGHEYGSLIAEVPATCSATGMEEHFECSACNKLFDSSKVETTEEELTIAIDSTAHSYGDWENEVSATCASEGTKAHKDCTLCNKHFDSSNNEITNLTIAVDSTAHSYGNWENEVPATCASEGTKEHKDCLLCGKHFDNTNTEITDLSIAKNENHDLKTVWTKAAGGHYHKCKREGCKDNGRVDFAAHTPNGIEATETDPIKCTECGYIITPALGHTHHLTLVAGEQATCSHDGKKPYYTCDGCEDKFADAEGTQVITEDIETWRIIPKAHKFGEWIAEVPATKEATGVKAHKDCEFCGKHFDNDGNEITDLTIAKLPSGGGETGEITDGELPNGGKDAETVDASKIDLSSGAIAGIAVGAVAFVGIAVFVIVWFAVKKKTFADIKSAKKGMSKKK